MIRVVLADDQALVRGGVRSLLDARDDIDVVGEAADGHEAVALAKQHRPDVVLMDIRMPGLDGLDATRQIASDPDLAAVRVVILTTFGSASARRVHRAREVAVLARLPIEVSRQRLELRRVLW